MKFYCLAFLILFSTSVFAKEKELPGWILGTWVNAQSSPFVFECWKKENNNYFSGISYSIVNADTVTHEKMEIVNCNDSIFFATIVSNQNQGKKIKFYCTLQNSKMITFENAKHNFPTKIVYEKTNVDSLLGKISGIKNGKLKIIEFPMKMAK